jgi:AraC family transcriptional regulator
MLTVNENHYAAACQPRHAHAETTATIVLRGSLRERVGRHDEIASPLSIVLKPRDTEHANEFGDGVHTLQIVLGEGAAAALEDGQPEYRRWGWQHGGPAVPAFLRLLHVRRSVPAGESVEVQVAAFDALASLIAASPCAERSAPRWLRMVRDALNDTPRPDSVRTIAVQAGVHPVYLAREFRRYFGMSITEHVARRRVQCAARLIGTTSRSLSHIAQDAGFSDHSHLCRVFARETGVAPSAYRHLVRS